MRGNYRNSRDQSNIPLPPSSHLPYLHSSSPPSPQERNEGRGGGGEQQNRGGIRSLEVNDVDDFRGKEMRRNSLLSGESEDDEMSRIISGSRGESMGLGGMRNERRWRRMRGKEREEWELEDEQHESKKKIIWICLVVFLLSSITIVLIGSIMYIGKMGSPWQIIPKPSSTDGSGGFSFYSGSLSEGIPCTSWQCTSAAARYINSINNSCDPCDDAFGYVCGKFVADGDIRSDESGIDTSFSPINRHLTLLKKNIYEKSSCDDILKYVESKKEEMTEGGGIMANNGKETKRQQPGQFDAWDAMDVCLYETCMDTQNLDKQGTTFLMKLIKQYIPFVLKTNEELKEEDANLNAEQRAKLLAERVAQLLELGVMGFFSVDSAINTLHPHLNITLGMSQSGLGLSYRQMEHEEYVDFYIHHISNLLRLFEKAKTEDEEAEDEEDDDVPSSNRNRRNEEAEDEEDDDVPSSNRNRRNEEAEDEEDDDVPSSNRNRRNEEAEDEEDDDVPSSNRNRRNEEAEDEEDDDVPSSNRNRRNSILTKSEEESPEIEKIENYIGKRRVKRFLLKRKKFGSVEDGGDVEKSEYYLRAKVIFEIEKDIRNISCSPEELRDPFKTILPYTWKEVVEMIPALNMQVYIQHFEKYFNKEQFRIHNELEVLLEKHDYFSKLNELILKKWSWISLHDYFRLRLIRYVSSSLSRSWRDELEDFTKKMSGRQSPERWKECVDGGLGWVLGRRLVRDYLDLRQKNVGLEIMREIRKTFREEFPRYEWMDKETIEESVKKLDYMDEKIGWPDWLLEDFQPHFENSYGPCDVEKMRGPLLETQVYFKFQQWRYSFGQLGGQKDKSIWEMFPYSVNAYFSSLRNEIVFPAAILLEPFMYVWNNEDESSEMMQIAFKALSYGGYGSVVGHEMTHGFDDQGRFFNFDGKLISWWTNATDLNFRKKSQCIEDQYSKYNVTVNFVDSKGRIRPKVLPLHGKLCEGENIADNGGLHLAYRSFVRQLTPGQINAKPLPGLDLTAKQLFMIAYAFLWCRKYRPQALENLVENDPHAPGEWRVNGPLQNLNIWAEEFKCAKGMKMNPPDVCRLW